MGFPRFHTEVIDHEAKHESQAGSTGVSENEPKGMSEVRNNETETIRETPPRLLETAGCGDSLHEMPRESGPGGGASEDQTAEAMQDLRRDVYSESQQKTHDMLKELLVGIGKAECHEAMEWAFTQTELLELRRRIRAAEKQGGDVLSILREQARMETTQSNPWANGEWPDQPRVEEGVPHRVDRLRCLGNAVVPQVAEFIGQAILESTGGSDASNNAP
jgi:site-specific DNA-cytosine methylase